MNVRIPTPEKMQKYPWGATVAILFSACLVLVGIIVNRPNDADKWRAAFEVEREKTDRYVTAMIVKNSIIEIKNSMIEDKNKDIEKLKLQNDSLKKALSYEKPN